MSPANSKQLGLGHSKLTGHFSQTLLTFLFNSQDDIPNSVSSILNTKTKWALSWESQEHLCFLSKSRYEKILSL